jgi:hypothetical protein
VAVYGDIAPYGKRRLHQKKFQTGQGRPSVCKPVKIDGSTNAGACRLKPADGAGTHRAWNGHPDKARGHVIRSGPDPHTEIEPLVTRLPISQCCIASSVQRDVGTK